MTFLTLFGLTAPPHVPQTPVCLYAGTEHNDLRRAMQDASNDGLFDHFQTGTTAGYLIHAPLPNIGPIGPIGPISTRSPSAPPRNADLQSAPPSEPTSPARRKK